jgi:hypothetical protein
MTMRKIEGILSITAFLFCLAVTIFLWKALEVNQPLWPFPALYFIEMAVLSSIVPLANIRNWKMARMVIWAIAGLFIGFVILGVLSVGVIYYPIALLILVVAILMEIRSKGNLLLDLGICLLAGVVQVVLMLLILQLYIT